MRSLGHSTHILRGQGARGHEGWPGRWLAALTTWRSLVACSRFHKQKFFFVEACGSCVSFLHSAWGPQRAGLLRLPQIPQCWTLVPRGCIQNEWLDRRVAGWLGRLPSGCCFSRQL